MTPIFQLLFLTPHGGIIDLGPIDFDEINEVAKSNYQPALEPEEIIEGHCYLVKTSTGQKFAKIEIITFSNISKTIKFRWQLANDSKKFSVLNEAQTIKT